MNTTSSRSQTASGPIVSFLVYAVLLVLFLLIVIGPLAALAADFIRGVLAGTVPKMILSLFTGRRAVLLLQTLGLAAAVAAAGTGTGLLITTALWRKPRVMTFIVLLLVLALIPIPPYIHALTWSSAVAAANTVLGTLGAAPLPVSGWLISFWVQFMALLPVAVFLCWIALASVDRSLVDAARTMRSDGEVLIRVILPLAAPTLTATSGFLFVMSCTDYSVPSLFSSDTYALDIFAYFSASASAAGALVCAIPLLIITFFVMGWCRTGIRRLAQTPNWTDASFDLPLAFNPAVRALQEGAIALFCIQVIVIFLGLILAAVPLSRLVTTIGFSAGEIRNSILIAALAVVIAIPLACAAARELLDDGIRGSFWWWTILAPLAVPAPLIGIGLITLWNTPPFTVLYGTILMPVFAALARFAPVAAIILFVQLRSVDTALFDAARIFTRDTFYSVRTVFVPLVTPGLFIASALLGALTLGELGATLIVIPPGTGTLAIKIYNYLHFGAATEVAGLCLVMAAAALAAGTGIAATVILRQKTRRAATSLPRGGKP
jgi:iron(III) transport system permease protein